MKIANLFCALSDAEVRYVLVGGLAVQLHGYMRSTFDVDLVLAMDDDNLARFIDVARRLGLKPSIPVPIDALRNSAQIEQWDREKCMLAFALREPHTGGGVVDVLVRPEVSFEQLHGNAVTGMLYSHPVWIASIDDLLTMKRIAGRPKVTSTSKHWKKYGVGKTRMAETKQPPREIIPEEVLLARLARSEEMREFFIEMWRQNPALARQGGARVAELMAPLESSGTPKSRQRGTSLIELIMFIVIVSVALAGILLTMNVTTKGSADPLIQKQAIASAESLLEEIQLQDFISASGVTNAVTQANRSTEYHIVSDYNGFSMPAGIISLNGAAVPGLGSYKANVVISDTALGTVAAGSAVLVTVTVTDPQNNDIQISGYRTAR